MLNIISCQYTQQTLSAWHNTNSRLHKIIQYFRQQFIDIGARKVSAWGRGREANCDRIIVSPTWFTLSPPSAVSRSILFVSLGLTFDICTIPSKLFVRASFFPNTHLASKLNICAAPAAAGLLCPVPLSSGKCQISTIGQAAEHLKD